MLKIKKLALTLVLTIFSIGFIGCGGTTTTTNTAPANRAENAANKAENAANKAENAANKAENAANKAANDAKPAANKETAGGGDTIGVPECDEYIAKYEACIMEKVPEAQRAMFKPTFETMRKSWKDAAATPQGKAGLAAGCKTALDTAKTSMSSFGCKF